MNEPLFDVYLPSSQILQLLYPVIELNFPGSHNIHSILPLVEYEPAEHSLQSLIISAPLFSLYFPSGHSLQVKAEVAPLVSLYNPLLQRLQLIDEFEAITSLHLPAEHKIQLFLVC